MANKKGMSHQQKVLNALKALPEVIEDKKHRIKIKFEDDQARSNESRFEHISLYRHELKVNDIKRIPKKINESELKKDDERTKTYSIYIKRNNYNNEFIKLSVTLDFTKSNEAKVKTIFITKNIK